MVGSGTAEAGVAGDEAARARSAGDGATGDEAAGDGAGGATEAAEAAEVPRVGDAGSRSVGSAEAPGVGAGSDF